MVRYTRPTNEEIGYIILSGLILLPVKRLVTYLRIYWAHYFMVVCPKIIKIGGTYMNQLQQKNIIFMPGRVFIDKGTPYQVSLPFTQISYCEPDALYKLGSLFFQFIENGSQLLSTKVAVERMNVRKSVDAGNLMVDLQMLDSGKNVEVKFV